VKGWHITNGGKRGSYFEDESLAWDAWTGREKKSLTAKERNLEDPFP